jgi:hypothetical protein
MQIQYFLSLKWKARLFILLFLFDNYNKEARKPRMIRKTGKMAIEPSKESCHVRPIPAYKAGLYGLTENRQLSESNSKPPFIPVHRTGLSGYFNKQGWKR